MFKAIIKSTANHMLAPLAAMSLLAACDLRAGSATTAAPSPAATNTPVSSTQAGSSASQSTSTSSAGPTLATADGEKTGVRIEVQELKRTSGDTLTLKFALINDSAESVDFGNALTEQGGMNIFDYRSISGVNLIEGVGKKKYFVVRDTEGACLCSRSMPNVASKSRVNLWAKFPAPPADASKITVVVPHFTPMEDVPISQ